MANTKSYDLSFSKLLEKIVGYGPMEAIEKSGGIAGIISTEGVSLNLNAAMMFGIGVLWGKANAAQKAEIDKFLKENESKIEGGLSVIADDEAKKLLDEFSNLVDGILT